MRKFGMKYLLLTGILVFKEVLLLTVIMASVSGSLWASDIFSKFKLSATPKKFVVLNDVNIRSGPGNKYGKIGQLRKNQKINSIGKFKSTRWILVEQNGKRLGFVYGSALAAVASKKSKKSADVILKGKYQTKASRNVSYSKYKLSVTSKAFLVLRDVNIRSGPGNKFRKIGRLKKNQQVNAVGRFKSTKWILVEKNLKKLGFVYGSALVPIIDGKLENSINGRLTGKTKAGRNLPACTYIIQFLKKVKIEGDIQVTSDYNLSMKCKLIKKIVNINATMFLTERPYLDNTKPIFQINVDLNNILTEDEEIFSVITLYHAQENKLTFDGVNKLKYKSNDKIAERKVIDISSALKGAVSMAHSVWGNKIWAKLSSLGND